MLYEFNVYQMEVDDHIFWVAESKALKGCVGQGETSEEAIKELEGNEKEWLDTAKEFGISIPTPLCKTSKTYTGKFALRMSPYVHEMAAEASRNLGISLNQFINDAVIEYTNSVKHTSRSPIKDDGVSGENIISFIPKEDPHRKNIIHVEELEEM